jgi:hypothetical protein
MEQGHCASNQLAPSAAALPFGRAGEDDVPLAIGHSGIASDAALRSRV